MDTSEQYIKMCEAAEEIQKLKQEKKTNPATRFRCSDNSIIDIDGDIIVIVGCISSLGKTKLIWLPRQDQLQAMIVGGFSSWHNAISFGRWCEEMYDYNDWPMEQLWLAFIMKEKYGKTWNGEKWEWI